MKTPQLHPQSITSYEYHTLCPEKLELLNGQLNGGEDLENLANLVLISLGLEKIVSLAPPEMWRQALKI